jgi:hypothetical protein
MLAVTLPGTTVMARTSSSGEFRASIRAIASSEPGSVSKMIFFGAAEASRVANASKNEARTSQRREQARRRALRAISPEWSRAVA